MIRVLFGSRQHRFMPGLVYYFNKVDIFFWCVTDFSSQATNRCHKGSAMCYPLCDNTCRCFHNYVLRVELVVPVARVPITCVFQN